jgi:hypothetical protein
VPFAVETTRERSRRRAGRDDDYLKNLLASF